MRVYELAKKYNIASKDLVQLLREMGVAAESHMSTLSEEAVATFEKHKKAQLQHATIQSDSVQQVVAPPPVHKPLPQPVKSATTVSHIEKKVQELQPAPSTLKLEPMLVTDFSHKSGKALGEVIGTLLRQGIVVSKNQMLSMELVEKLATAFALPFERSAPLGAREAVGTHKPLVKSTVETGGVRQPIVVVMGHVDHGKTTLLDTIRKTRVAIREKGGITQHLGAYEAETSQGKITFLDTPGHAAFSMIRSRGAHIADIAILVVAADDGVKPQTIEALRVAQEAHIPIIVAINKIDRASQAHIEAVKRDLAQHNLVPEEWGGQTVMVPIVAKTGQGVDALLEMINLQAQMMELSASTEASPKGFIIEATVERGLGFVATVIGRQGIFRVGDTVVAGGAEGRIVTIINAQGRRLQEALPAVPVLVSGFKSLPRAGDEISEHSLRGDSAPHYQSEQRAMPAFTGHGNGLRLMVKADNASSLEAVVQAIQKGFKGAQPLTIIQQGVGSISESDVTYASESGALLYGLHVKWEARAQELAQRLKVDVRVFDIIYALLDDIALKAQPQKKAVKVLKKTGEALVLKVFDIKKMGVIAGSLVKSGLFTRNGSVKIFRGKQEIGTGDIKSLQRERKPVKEVHAGYECAFLVEGFSDWHEGDRVECYQETVS